MKIILKNMITSSMLYLLLILLTLGVTFFAFPLDDWTKLWKQEVYDVPYWVYIISIPVVLGMITGFTAGLFWRQRFKYVERQLETLVKEQKLPSVKANYKEVIMIEKYIEKLYKKLRHQAELSQKLVTERTTEREQSLQEIVVQERNRLARELHDSVSQQLFAASMMMSAINETNPPKNANLKKQLFMVEKMIHQSQLEMRALLLHLRPVALKGKSLQEGTEELLHELTQKVPIEIDWKVEDFHADKGVEDQLFRILQESVSNTLRHANASTLYVLLIERDDHVIMRIVDNGAGFDVHKVKTSSYGLTNMQERAEELGGILKVISLPGEGTRIEVKIPVLHKEGDLNN